jgi:prepilin-type processing-associated H-X9-DG protein/prepilin-type N-terminal cleavage/methylation domain-containing protein
MRKKFSLIELLVVVAIIGILASLLAPTLKSARGKSKAAVCKSTIGQLGVSAYMFADDNDGNIPLSTSVIGGFPNTNGRWWTHALDGGGYVKGTEAAMSCPSLPYEGDWSDEDYVTYGASRHGGRTGEITSPYGGFKLTEVESPSEFFWFADSAKTDNSGTLHQWNNFLYHSGADQRIHTRHDEAANLWFADGHVSSNKIGALMNLGIGYIRTENGTALNF